jgi:hypothetical protein
LAESEGEQLPKHPEKSIPYKESIYCPVVIILKFSLLLTFIIDLLALFGLGAANVSVNTFQWILGISIPVFSTSFVYTKFRYRIKLKVSRRVFNKRLCLSIKGVGKGSWRWIPVESVISCKSCDYASPVKGFLFLLLTSNAPVGEGVNGSTSAVALPGYAGKGIAIQYRNGQSSTENDRELLVPTNNPDILCALLECMNESTQILDERHFKDT